MKHYTLGEIYRLGLLKNHNGKPYTQKASVSRIVSRMKHTQKKTIYGIAKVVSEAEIKKHNSRYKVT